MDTPRRVLVTGANGALGSAVMRALALHKDAVTAIPWVRDSEASLARNGAVAGDIRDRIATDAILARVQPNAVVHLAGITGVACDEDPQRTFETNVEATANLGQAAASVGATRLVFASSAAVYGDSGTTPFRETDALAGTTAYAQSKIQAEATLAKIVSNTGLEVVCLRIFNVYGPEFPASLISRLQQASATDPVVLRGGEKFIRDYVHCDDVASVMWQSLHVKLDQPLNAVNVGTGRAMSNAQLLAALPGDHRAHVKVEPGGASYSVANTDLGKRLFHIDMRHLTFSR